MDLLRVLDLLRVVAVVFVMVVVIVIEPVEGTGFVPGGRCGVRDGGRDSD